MGLTMSAPDLRKYAEELVKDWPPLTPEQRDIILAAKVDQRAVGLARRRQEHEGR